MKDRDWGGWIDRESGPALCSSTSADIFPRLGISQTLSGTATLLAQNIHQPVNRNRNATSVKLKTLILPSRSWFERTQEH